MKMRGERTIRLTMALSLAALQFSARAQTVGTRAKPSAAVPMNAQAQSLSTSSTAGQALPLTPAQRPAHRAEVIFKDGQLSVSAENASLNQILREIGRQTGIAISGGVAEERVFGKYGPAPASDLLATLLDGTGSNVLLIPGEDGAKGQLILTPRHGGPTPPNPNAPGFDDDAPTDNENVQRLRQPNQQGVSLYGATPPTQAAPASVVPATPPGTGASAPANATDPQSPNGVKTPQEIFQQLQQLRQQQQSQPPPPQ